MENKSKSNFRGYGIVFVTAGLGCVAVSAALALGWTGSPTQTAIDALPPIDMTELDPIPQENTDFVADIIVDRTESDDLEGRSTAALELAALDIRPFIAGQNRIIASLKAEKTDLEEKLQGIEGELESVREENMLLEAAISQFDIQSAQSENPVDMSSDPETPSSFIDVLSQNIAALTGKELGKTVESINTHLDAIDESVATFSKGENIEMSADEREIFDELRVQLLDAQKTSLPELRNNLGPALRARYEGKGISVYTTGDGYKTIMIKSDLFRSIEDIKAFHEKNHEELVRMRFSEAVYTDFSGEKELGRVEVKSVPDDMFLINDRQKS